MVLSIGTIQVAVTERPKAIAVFLDQNFQTTLTKKHVYLDKV